MTKTEEEINTRARAYSLTPNYFATTNQMRHKAFAEGAKWAIESRSTECTCKSTNYGYGFTKCFDCGKFKAIPEAERR